MKKNLFLIVLFTSLNAFSQSYNISFEGTGESTSVSTVIAENLSKGSSVTLNGSDILRLNIMTGISEATIDKSGYIKIFPNPTTNISTIEVYPPNPGNAIITVSDMTGSILVQDQRYLETSKHVFNISGLKKGLYLITISSSNYRLTGSMIRLVDQGNKTIIEDVTTAYSEYKIESKVVRDNKGIKVVDMEYSVGDLIKFTGISGNYSTVKVDNPTENKTINFDFVTCKDGDNNNYPVVSIGTQTWMAANLKTTKYSDGTNIPFVNTDNGWDILVETDKAFCYLQDNASNGNIYGALYTWAAAMNGASGSNSIPSGVQGACPTGWHLPGIDEWTLLFNYLGGLSQAGGKMKETGTSHWSINSGATNESGFTATPGGFREDWGWQGINIFGGWWSATDIGINSWTRWTEAASNAITSLSSNKKYGISVRCLKN